MKEITAVRESHGGVYLVCNNVYVGGICQSNIHMNIRIESSEQNISQNKDTQFSLVHQLPFLGPPLIGIIANQECPRRSAIVEIL